MTSHIEELFGLRGKVAMISGASRGIGRGVANFLSKSGVKVYGIGSSDLIDNHHFSYYKIDISNLSEFNKLCKTIYKEHENIDIYIHVAGITNPHPNDHFLNFNKTIEVNLSSVFHCCNSVAKFMPDGGSIINISSIAAIQGFPNNPGYVASKGGVCALTKALAIDLGIKGIRVNDISPGYIKTDMTQQSFKDPVRRQERLNRMIIPRWGVVDDIIGAAVFLASDSSSYMTGSSIVVDGGWTAKGM